jgi:hypothetical protein
MKVRIIKREPVAAHTRKSLPLNLRNVISPLNKKEFVTAWI